jgi:transglutaminase-like putative cysteine protease
MTRSFLARLTGRFAWMRLPLRIDQLALLRLALLFLALFCLARGLSAVVQDLLLVWLLSTAWLGLLAGWLLARTSRPAWQVCLLALFLGLLWLVFGVGRMSLPLQALFESLFDLAAQLIRLGIGLVSHPPSALLPPDPRPLFEAWSGLIQGLLALSARVLAWARGLFSGGLVIDPVVTDLAWCAQVWLGSVWAAWNIRRQGAAFLGLLPVTALLAYNDYYVNSARGLTWLAILGGCILLLQALESYHSARLRWQASRLDRVSLEPGLAAAVLLSSLALMLLGLLTPSLSVRDLSRRLQDLLDQRRDGGLAESLGLQQTPGASGGTGRLTTVSIASRHPIGAGPQLSDEVVFFASIEGYVASPNGASSAPDDQRLSLPFYWRSQTFDYYNGHGWGASVVSQADYPANRPLFDPPASGDTSLLTQQVQRLQRVGVFEDTVFVSGELSSLDQPSHAIWRAAGDLVGAQTQASVYRAESRLPSLTISQLRLAGTDYPAAIRDRYLQLPDSLPPRVTNLALDLTAAQPTPYDQVLALQAWLHNFPYTLLVPAPPADRDAVDFFLFDLQKGYCDYYASAMTVMARAAGIPARLVTGYTRGTFDGVSGRFVVTAANAHSWVEIYFPIYGWVEFEPTASQPAIAPRQGAQAPPGSLPTGGETGRGASGIFPHDWLRLLAPALALALLGLLLLFLFPFESLALLLVPTDRAVPFIYRHLYRRGRSFSIQRDAARSPCEFLTLLKTRLEPLPGQKRSRSASAALVSDLDWLTGLYARQLYSPIPPSSREGRRAAWVWYRLQRRLAWIRLGELLHLPH